MPSPAYMRLLFISDLHLAPEAPRTVEAFLAFLRGPAVGADALYILGDLFEYWLGDDDCDSAFNQPLLAALHALSASGTPISFIAGNRDFLAAHGFAEAAGLSLQPDPYLLEVGGQRLLLSHGDALCTDDVAYQAYRQQVRNPAVQADFLSRPMPERRAIIQGLRERSEQAKQGKAYEIMDVNADALAHLLRENGYPVLIHGHIHRPALHRLEVDGRPCERWVLSDWHGAAPYLEWVDGVLSVHCLEIPAAA